MKEVADKLNKVFPRDKAKTTEYLQELKTLLEQGEKIDPEDPEQYWTWDLLSCAVYEKSPLDLEIIELMMLNGLRIYHTNGNEKKTPLHFAVHAGNLDAARYLFHADSDPDAKDSKGISPAMLAINSGHRAISKLFEQETSSITDSGHTFLPSPKNSPTSRHSLTAEEEKERTRIQRLIDSRK